MDKKEYDTPLSKVLGKLINRAELAREAGISKTYLTFIESGKVEPSVKVATKIAELLHTHIDVLFPNIKRKMDKVS